MDRALHGMKKPIFVIFLFLAIPFFVFFITGFIFYKPAKSASSYDSMKIRIENILQESSPPPGDNNEAREQDKRESEQLSKAAQQLPLLNENVGAIKVSTRYEGLLAQMGSILSSRMQASDALDEKEKREQLSRRTGNHPADEGVPAGYSLGGVMRERMVIIEDVLKYASSQADITVDLLAAVAWAESKMLPYAVNVEGKAYYFTSKEQALNALRGLATDNVDIGLFQVNYRLWGGPLGLKKEDLLDSKVCAFIGAMILKYNLQRHRDPWVAVGRYHSGDINRMKAYQTKVSRGLMIIRTFPLISRENGKTAPSDAFREEKRGTASFNKEVSDS